MRFLTITLGCFMFMSSLSASDDIILPSDIDRLVGGYWIGKLTYLDYTSHERTSIRTGLRVEKLSKRKPVWRFHYQYPDEPHANQSSRICLTGKGRKINGAKVIRRALLDDGQVEIVTEKRKGKRMFRYTYQISDTTFSIRKEEAMTGSSNFMERNTYAYEREIPVNES